MQSQLRLPLPLHTTLSSSFPTKPFHIPPFIPKILNHKTQTLTIRKPQNRSWNPIHMPYARGGGGGGGDEEEEDEDENEEEVTEIRRKLRLLCLHGVRTSAEIMQTQIRKRWPQSLMDKMELVFIDAPFLSQGKSEMEGKFDPPYYEWFQHNKEFTEFQNLDVCYDYIEECMMKYGPFDGLLGFSMGGLLSGALPGLQSKGLALTKVPKIRVVIIMAAGEFQNKSLAKQAYSPPIDCPSAHIIGNRDPIKNYSIELSKSFLDPVVILHRNGHTIPKFDEEGLNKMLRFLENVLQKKMAEQFVNNVKEQGKVWLPL